MTCGKCGAEEAAPGDRWCLDCRAAYMRDYRSHAVNKRKKLEHFKGFEEGIAAAAVFLRTAIGDRCYTGLQVAVLLERAHIASEAPEAMQRAAFIATLRQSSNAT